MFRGSYNGPVVHLCIKFEVPANERDLPNNERTCEIKENTGRLVTNDFIRSRNIEGRAKLWKESICISQLFSSLIGSIYYLLLLSMASSSATLFIPLLSVYVVLINYCLCLLCSELLISCRGQHKELLSGADWCLPFRTVTTEELGTISVLDVVENITSVIATYMWCSGGACAYVRSMLQRANSNSKHKNIQKDTQNLLVSQSLWTAVVCIIFVFS